jgi:hypothetical protein
MTTKTSNAPDMINAPPHYIGKDGIEAIDVIERYSLDYHLGSAFAYLVRADKKGAPIVDLKKARYYCVRWLELYTANEIEEPTADEDTVDWFEPDDIVVAFDLSGNVATAVVVILSMSVFTPDDEGGYGGMMERTIADLDVEIAAREGGALPVPHRVSA